MIEYDEIGIWSEVKLAIIKEYASAYSTILEGPAPSKIYSLKWLYIDAYAGPGLHLSKRTGEVVDGSPSIALKTNPPFFEYHFIDTDLRRADQLRGIAGDRNDVFVYTEDCNKVLLRDVFPRAKHRDYRRALLLLDPYNINLTWEVIEAAGQMRSVDVFLNFMIMDINRNALTRNPDKAIQSKVDSSPGCGVMIRGKKRPTTVQTIFLAIPRKFLTSGLKQRGGNGSKRKPGSRSYPNPCL